MFASSLGMMMMMMTQWQVHSCNMVLLLFFILLLIKPWFGLDIVLISSYACQQWAFTKKKKIKKMVY